MATLQRVLGSNHRNTWKLFKNLFLQNHLPQMLETGYVALPISLLPSLFKPKSQNPIGFTPGVLGSNHRNAYEKKSSSSEPLGSDA